MPKLPKFKNATVPYEEDLTSLPKYVKEAKVLYYPLSAVKYKRHESYDGGTYWAAEDVKIPKDAKIYMDVIIGPDVELSKGIEIGKESRIGTGSIIGSGTVIGKRVHIGENCTIGEDVNIGNGVWIDNQVTIEEGSTIGEGSSISSNATVKGELKERSRVFEYENYNNSTKRSEQNHNLYLTRLKRK